MSPIRASERARYPAYWPEVSRRIRFVRALGQCECTGQCGHDHAAEPRPWPSTDPRCEAKDGCRAPVTGSKVVLTVAHLDHQPEHCQSDNLLAMCQRCHLAYDAEHHAETRAAARRERLAEQMEPLW